MEEQLTENQLYEQQMTAWFEEHDRLGKQIERAIEHHTEIAELNRQQLDLHNRRMDIALAEYNGWAKDNGLELQPLKS
ncbi:hypothetical protein [Paenibacillus wynnii]|uniref:Uncharacterized protein n=1 Tax=Paenibacillus wynnii TaxID=268407 RepID=A0A098MF14_9BACL|nr:hypothetical protein [Paenibacillus wynnii]KGE20651.1 hypothetical protein PWYN_00120 [Paenibacillus wynnii]KGE20709.1 hypothetical protein PWYN_00545 [Paenibacillus wynnii]